MKTRHSVSIPLEWMWHCQTIDYQKEDLFWHHKQFSFTDFFQIFGMVPFIFPKLFFAPLFLYLEHCECR